jgi:hypothetical protein
LNGCGDSLPCWEPSEWGVVTGRYLRGSERARRRTRGIAYALVVACGALVVSDCAQGQQGPGQVSTQTTTVHGIVRVGVSGDPLPHALVRIGGDASTGVLTDGDGRFEIPEIPAGPQEFTITKPGFLDDAEAAADSIAWNSHGYGHNVIVAAGMGDVMFTMEPANSIRGQIQLSTGEAAQGIQLMLLRRTVRDGRAVWQESGTTHTNSEGVYRFGGLTDGSYAVYTMPAMDSDAPILVQAGVGGNVARAGYPSLFYPDARDLAGAAKIQLHGGEQSQANMALTLERFQPVVARVTSPGESDDVTVQVLDGRGNLLPYPAQYDASTHTAQAMLPEGNYLLSASILSRVFHIASTRNPGATRMTQQGSYGFAGEVSFTVATRPVTHLSLPLAAVGNSPVQVSVSRTRNTSPQEGLASVVNASASGPPVYVTVTQAGGWISDGMVTSYAEGPASGQLRAVAVPSGTYWVSTAIGPKTMCEASFTAGGANLAREPLRLGIGGNTAPLMLSLRDDCARLTLSLPGSVAYTAGEERAYTVYVVPDFDSTQGVVPQTLRVSTGGRVTLTGLTPGSYRVFTFDRPVALEYRNPEVLASVPSQAVSLEPTGDAELTVEVPQR